MLVVIVVADSPAPYGARTSAATILAYMKSRISLMKYGTFYNTGEFSVSFDENISLVIKMSSVFFKNMQLHYKI